MATPLTLAVLRAPFFSNRIDVRERIGHRYRQFIVDETSVSLLKPETNELTAWITASRHSQVCIGRWLLDFIEIGPGRSSASDLKKAQPRAGRSC